MPQWKARANSITLQREEHGSSIIQPFIAWNSRVNKDGNDL